MIRSVLTALFTERDDEPLWQSLIGCACLFISIYGAWVFLPLMFGG